MNYLIYPCRVMKLTQNHADGNHKKHSSGKPADFPFDECCGSTGRSGFYCPCDEMEIVKVYRGGVNTVWMTSVSAVMMPYGKAYVTVMVEHVEDEDLEKLTVGQRFARGELMFYEGKDGATGNHFHISVGSGLILGTGWIKNSGGAWVLQTTGTNLRADEAFYLEDTTVKECLGYAFKVKPKEEPPTDNIPDKYAAAAVAWALQKKILQGDDRGDKKLHHNITRQDALVMLYRALH